jgi:hypothetical protein
VCVLRKGVNALFNGVLGVFNPGNPETQRPRAEALGYGKRLPETKISGDGID